MRCSLRGGEILDGECAFCQSHGSCYGPIYPDAPEEKERCIICGCEKDGDETFRHHICLACATDLLESPKLLSDYAADDMECFLDFVESRVRAGGEVF